ncbi:MlaA family lipoprotein [Stutzerimonas kirkiae]|uniref:ABC transporter n=1 Tax=Stutzerimonas kirkiae TaxID=2211392 RepID=A0A4Q9RFU0_9GAMM|nr:VacJ family lipoprotein [Stutzerimonas kirkiae]TBU99902.1 ABC transporter [Stutzerimonas kirkiae]TBV05608.1 ABC transporter [Stutzerimonas kirkiae]TBV10651.1 ABC transporter [Stutzerimonas kirkiae]TBV17506.1 ABC transporter [Stutzerimonas kirkiae]
MNRRHIPFLAALLLTLPCAHAHEAQPDSDGFKQPLRSLTFNPGLDQHEFERATLRALKIHDPFESFNRRMYHFNYRLDQWVMLPTVRGYQAVTPRFVRTGVSNFFNNLGEISNLSNSLLQGKGVRAMNATARLLFNSIIGVGGVWDPATRMGLVRQSEDFGQTLGFYGVPAGPYLILPALGPSNARDTGGRVFDFAAERQMNYLDYAQASGEGLELTALRLVDIRYSTPFRYGQLNSPFEYEKLRYIYSKARELQIQE